MSNSKFERHRDHRSMGARRQKSARRVWSAAAAISLILIGAVLTPVGQRVVDRWFHPVDPLLVGHSWPVGRSCDSVTEIAVSKKATQPDSVVVNPSDDRRAALVAAGGAAFGSGDLTLELSTSAGATIQVLNLKPLIYSRSPSSAGWVYTPQGGCGDTYERTFELDLDRQSIRDVGVKGGGDGAPDATIRVDPLGPAFNVSGSDPALLHVRVHSCTSAFEWGLRIDYSYEGRDLHRIVGTPDAPFRSTGKPKSKVFAYTDDYLNSTNSLIRYGVAEEPRECGSR
jgi:hypothetical protein